MFILSRLVQDSTCMHLSQSRLYATCEDGEVPRKSNEFIVVQSKLRKVVTAQVSQEYFQDLT